MTSCDHDCANLLRTVQLPAYLPTGTNRSQVCGELSQDMSPESSNNTYTVASEQMVEVDNVYITSSATAWNWPRSGAGLEIH